MKYQKGDYRAHGPLTSKPLTVHPLGKKDGYPENKIGPNRHERRREKALILRSVSFLKGKPTASIIRRMVRTQGLRETILLMHGKTK